MRRITMWLAVSVAALVLLFTYRTSTGGTRIPTTAVTGAPASVVSADSGNRALTVNGPAIRTRWGPVQVQLHITGQRITDVGVLQQPTGSAMDQAINAYALPTLRAQALAAQSAHIHGVSGATVTTTGYVQSLQAAIDAAHFTGTPTGPQPSAPPAPPNLHADEDD